MSRTTDHPANLSPERLLVECNTRRTRRSGPGGQNRNKVETAIVLVHEPTGVGAEASERRSQAENLRIALFRLRVSLALAVRLPPPLEGSPSMLWRARCRGGRMVVSTEHDDFPSLLAEALDVIDVHAGDVKGAALALGCTPTQLTKLLKSEPRAILQVNDQRRGLGLHPLH
jgi:hypothetical protein